jgi:hypothetical protein
MATIQEGIIPLDAQPDLFEICNDGFFWNSIGSVSKLNSGILLSEIHR